MKTIKAVYGCSYCGFTSESPKIVGKHEYNCENNPKMPSREDSFKTQKAHKRKQMCEAKSLNELNEMLKDYINTYYKGTSFSSIANHNPGYYWSGEFKINNYQLTNCYSSELKTLGISTILNDYPNLLEKVQKLKEYNKIKSEFSKDFKTKLNSHLKNRTKSELEKSLEEQNKELSLKINELNQRRYLNNETLEEIQNDVITKFKEETNYIDYNELANKVKNELKG